MKTENRQFGKQNGSALILVVVVTVLLAVIGVMFLMVSRASEMESGAVISNKDLDSAVDTVVAKINEVLVEDLFGNDSQIVDSDPGASDEPYDVVDQRDPWLASLEPRWFNAGPDGLTGTPADMGDDNYVWPRITDLYENNFGVPSWYYDPQSRASDFSLVPPSEWDGSITDLQVDSSDTLVKIISPKDRTYAVDPIPPADADWDMQRAAARADADGDGVADSRWVQVPGLTTSRGEPVFAAVRIIDNCAMLNLNAAHCFYQDSYATGVSPFTTPWYATEPDLVAATPYHDNQSGSGRYLTEINYMPFLRGHDLNGNFFDGGTGGDDWYNLMLARGMYDTVADLPYSAKNCQAFFDQIENPISGYQFFGIGDELELRNRYLVTSKVESRFEQVAVANYTLDSGNGAGGAYAALEVPRDTTNDFGSWTRRIDPINFDKFNPVAVANNDEYEYDRRHVCTVYSYDRNIRKGQYPLLDEEITAYLATNPPLPANFASMQEYEHYLWKVFTPKGAVTTNIENLNAAQSYNNIETRKRILHLLYGLREYYLPANYFALLPAQQVIEKNTAALKAAQVVANIIDFSDDSSINTNTFGETQGPFYDPPFPLLAGGFTIDFGQQANADCTFATIAIIDQMLIEVSQDVLSDPANAIFNQIDPSVDTMFSFGLSATDIVFGYERQPFISEIFANWDGALGVNAALKDFAVELVNPYAAMIDIKDWRIKIGTTLVPALSTFNATNTDIQWQVPGASPPVPVVPGAPDQPGYAVLHGSPSTVVTFAPGGVVLTDPITDFDSIDTTWSTPANSLEIQLLRPAPKWVQNNFPDPTNPGVNIQYILADRVSDTDVRSILNNDGQHNLERDDDNWKFIYGQYAPVKTISPVPTNPYTMVTNNTASIATITNQFQIGVSNDGLSLARWHDLEVLGLYGNGDENSADPNAALTTRLASLSQATDTFHFDLTVLSNNPLDYVTTINRPDLDTLPGRINVNTAPVHVIAAAIPPLLADPGVVAAGPSGYSSLNLAQDIVNGRPYASLSDLLSVLRMKQYDNGGVWATENIGMQSIQDDIEEEHWILSNLANKFTVRSDVFTAYILVRLGETGPQRRMIGIFDRSQVWDKTDRPKLVALHPVPDPR